MSAPSSIGKPSRAQRDELQQANLIRFATLYARCGGEDNWRELCRAKATLDALRRCGA